MNSELQLPMGWTWETMDSIKAPGRSIVSGPFGSNIGKRFFVEHGVPVIRGNNLSLGMERFKDEGFVFLTEDKAAEFANCEAHPDDLIFTAAGTIGQVGIIPKTSKFPKYIISNKQLRARLDAKKVRPLFAYYWLASPPMVATIQNRNTGSTIPLINLSVLKSLTVPIPPLGVQDSIVSILSCLDDRIALLRETNATLEAIAQALFKSWFVDFDPVHTRARGEMSTGLSPETAALFPDSFDESELGMVPKGWQAPTIGDVCTLGRGSSPRPIQEFMGTDIPWIKIADATASDGMFVFSTKEKIRREGASKSVAVRHGDLIMSNSASCGIPVFVELEGCIHDGWLYFKGYRGTTKNLLFFWLRMISDHLVHIADGSVQKNLNTTLVSTQRIISPPASVLESFDVHVQPLMDRVRANCKQAQTLATLRDTLLPRLISGQLRLPDLEKEVSHAIQ